MANIAQLAGSFPSHGLCGRPGPAVLFHLLLAFLISFQSMPSTPGYFVATHQLQPGNPYKSFL
jgi:hypothetical protein